MEFPQYLAIGHHLAESLPNPRRFLRNWNAIFKRVDDKYPVVLANAHYWIQNTPKAWLGLNSLERFLNNSSGLQQLFDFLEQYPSAFEILWSSLSKTPHLASILIRNPNDFYWLLEESALGQSLKKQELRDQFHHTIFTFKSPYRRHSFLHRLHRRHFLRIAMRDVLNLADFQHTIFDLSVLAEILVETVTKMVLGSFAEKDRLPDSRYSVIALGKLGGGELNYSSDIDLMFVYEEDGKLPNGETYNNAFQKISEEISRVLNEQSEHGALYRVDTRLRPDGASGILCQSVSAYMHYYENRGRLWERQMLIKANPVAGDIQFGKKVLEKFKPFIYPRHIQYPLEDIVIQRTKSETKSGEGINVKTDPGGIRDIEFIVQALQLQFGGHAPHIRHRNTLAAIDKLAIDEEFLSQREAEFLKEKYVFLREVEHALQLQENLQVHVLPDQEPEDLIIASLLDSPDYVTLYARTRETMVQVRELFNDIFHTGELTTNSDYANFTENDWIEYFEEKGFENPQKSSFQIQSLATGRFPKNHDTATREAFWKMCPHLLEYIETAPSPSDVLTDFERIVRSYQAINSLYNIFASNPDVLKLLINLISHASKTVPWIVQNPGLIETLISLPDENLTGEDFQRVFAPVGTGTFGLDKWHSKTMQLRNEILVTLLAQGLVHQIEIPEQMYQFSQANKCLLKRCIDFWLGEISDSICIIIAGSAASDTMVFSSDFDLVFILKNETDTIDITKRIENFIQQLERYTSHGRLYSFDFRLRPEGKSAPLIMTEEKYHAYINERMSPWEFQALGKSTFLWGDQSIANSVYDQIDSALSLKITDPGFWQDLHSIEREAIRQKIQRKGINYVYHPGGLFTTQNTMEWHALLHQHLESIDAPISMDSLKSNLHFLHAIKWNLALNMEGSTELLSRSEKKLKFSSKIMGYDTKEEFLGVLHTKLEHSKYLNQEYRSWLLQKFE